MLMTKKMTPKVMKPKNIFAPRIVLNIWKILSFDLDASLTATEVKPKSTKIEKRRANDKAKEYLPVNSTPIVRAIKVKKTKASTL